MKNCLKCKSENTKQVKSKNFSATFCNDCFFSSINYEYGKCCNNPDLVDVRFEQANFVLVQRVACKNCKSFKAGAKKRDSNFEKLSFYSQEAYIKYQKEIQTERSNLSAVLLNMRNSLNAAHEGQFWHEYKTYLQSPLWKNKRRLALERDKHICQGCLINNATHVHHLTYDNFKNELIFQLISLCIDCHQTLHPEKDLNS